MARFSAACVVLVAASWACSSERDVTLLPLPNLPAVAEGNAAFLGFPERPEDWRDSPLRLSETGVFWDLASLQPQPGLLPYSVQAPLYSDGTGKQRWVALPRGQKIGFAEHGAWTFPEGTVFVKQFDLALDERQPEVLRRLETRFLIAARGGSYYGLSYEWNEEQTDAELALAGRDEQLTVIAADGVSRVQTYSFPAQSDCARCHSTVAGGALGPHTAQLNGEHVYFPEGEAFPANQLSTWENLGLFDREIGHRPTSDYPQLANLADETRPAEERLRSYWDSNCSMCHNADSPLPSWDARYVTPLARQGVIGAESYAGPRADELLLVTPGRPEASLMYLRATSTEPRMRMPPLLRNRVDTQYVSLLESWIASLPPAGAAR